MNTQDNNAKSKAVDSLLNFETVCFFCLKNIRICVVKNKTKILLCNIMYFYSIY